jgi:hypothetical protein
MIPNSAIIITMLGKGLGRGAGAAAWARPGE